MRNVQTIDGKWHVLEVDTGGYFFYWNWEKYYLTFVDNDYRMRVVRRYEIVEL